jgi:hypothetical protein
MNKKILIVLMIVSIVSIALSGCFESSIRVAIDSDYDFDAMGDIKVDGVKWGTVYSPANHERTYNIPKSELPDKNSYDITLMLESGAVKKTATAYDVKTYVKFHVGGTPRYTEFGYTEDHYIEVVDKL